MASTSLSSGYQSKAFHLLGLFCLMLLMQKGGARELTVGGSKGWTIPDNSTALVNYDQWAHKNRFQIGDSLVFVYPPGQDSVLQVSKEDYANCTTTSPIATYSDGHTVFQFSQSGPYYFISGNKDNCDKNEKLVVIVMADRSNHSSTTNQTTAASPPSPEPATPVPSPAPMEESPPEGTVEINPTPAPVNGPPKSAASSVFISFVGSVGAFIASSFILVF